MTPAEPIDFKSDGNGWREHQLLVLNEIKRADRRLAAIEAQINGLRVDLQVLRAKVFTGATVLGAGSGTLVSVALSMLKTTGKL